MSSQLIELLWRNKAYVLGISDPDGSQRRKGAMFAGFKTEMGFDNEKRIPQKKQRQEYIGYDRMTVYPGMVQDNKYSYMIGPNNGLDPASLDLPASMQIPRTIKTEVYDENMQLSAIDTFHDGAENGSGPQVKENVPSHFIKPGMLVRRRARYAHDDEVVAETYASAQFVDDIDFSNAGDTTISIDLAESIAGVGAVLKKVVIQCSKVDHHISEVTLDFSDLTRGSGSISSSEHPQANLLTILMDGKEKVHTAYFDCKMGKFGSNKFKLGVKGLGYFPPMTCEAGGFDGGSQVASAGELHFHCEKSYEPAIQAEQQINPLDNNLLAPDHLKRKPEQAWPNPMRGIPGANSCGATMVADAVNQGFDMIGTTKDNQEVTTQAHTVTAGTTSDMNDNNSKYEGSEIVANANICWRRPGCSSYTIKPRSTRGTILAINVVLQADAGF